MPPLVVPSAALLRLVWNMGASPYAVNVIGARKTSPAAITQSQANSLGAAVGASFTSSGLAAQVHSGVSLTSVGIRDISAPSLPELVAAMAAVPGANAGNMLPPQIAFCVTLRTALAGRSFRGRVYLPGFTVGGNTTSGGATATVSTACLAFVNGIDSAMAANGLDLAIVSRLRSTSELVTLVQARDLTWDTIRGRATAGI